MESGPCQAKQLLFPNLCLDSSILCCSFFVLFFKSEEKERDFPLAGSVPKWLYWQSWATLTPGTRSFFQVIYKGPGV